MNKTIRSFMLVAVALSAVACADPCGDLEEQCGDCSGTDTASTVVEAACKAVVEADDSDACDAALDTAAYKCP